MSHEKDKLFKTLPADVQQNVRAQLMDDAQKKALSEFVAMMDQSSDCLLSLAVVAFGEASSDEEREEVIKATTVAQVTMDTIRVVFEHGLPAGPRTALVELFKREALTQIQRYDAIMRKALPEGAERRREAINETLNKVVSEAIIGKENENV